MCPTITSQHNSNYGRCNQGNQCLETNLQAAAEDR